MSRRITIVTQLLLTVAVPLLLVGNMLWVLAQPWLVDALYAVPGIPIAMPELDSAEQAELAVMGVRAVQPLGDGTGPLSAARLPDGGPVFARDEVGHLGDVRALIHAFTIAWALALLIISVAVLARRRLGTERSVLRSLAAGGLLTLGVVGLLGVVMLLSFDTFFVAFHGLLFEEGSWRFGPEATLLHLYPEPFWALTGGLAVALIVGQALALVLVARRHLRHGSWLT
jgi:integral membrane protein (TIGR01906 family)